MQVNGAVADVRPAFEVHRLNGEQPHTIYKYVAKRTKTGESLTEDGKVVETFRVTHEREEVVIKRSMGSLAIMANGNAFHIPTDDMLRRLKLSTGAPLVDMATGDVLQTVDRSLTAMASRAGPLIPSDVTFANDTPNKAKGGK